MKNIYINTIIMTGTECSSQKDFIKEAALLDLPIQGVEVRREYFPFDQKEKEEEICKSVIQFLNHYLPLRD